MTTRQELVQPFLILAAVLVVCTALIAFVIARGLA